MFFENGATCRGGTVFLRIGMKRSFFFMMFRRESTHALEGRVPLLDPDSVRLSDEEIVRKLQRRIGDGDAEEDRVVEHERVRAPVPEREERVREAVGDDELRVLVTVLHPAVVHRAARRRDRLPGEVARELIDPPFLTSRRPVAL